MKIGIISDIHGNVYGLRAVLEKLKDVDVILCAGDIVGYYPFVNEVFEELKKHRVIFIKGNHDRTFLGEEEMASKVINDSLKVAREIISKENLAWLKKTKPYLRVELDGIKIEIDHESPWNTSERVYPDFSGFEKFNEVNADVIILGHTHYPLVKKVGEKMVINPGSCGQPRDNNPLASAAIFNTKTRKLDIIRVAYDQRPVIEAVKNYGLSDELIDILKRG